jgi:isopentenyldiphosphate isomerase
MDAMIGRKEDGVETDRADEMVDHVDANDRVIGRVSRAEMRARKLRHRAVFVAITDGSGRLLVHRRSAAKDIWPGWCDIAVGGVVSAGEDYATAARRELAEEIGIERVELFELDEGRALIFDDDSVSLIGRCYQIITTGPFVFADGEVAEAWWVDREQLEQACRIERFLPDSLALVLPRIRW